MAASKSCTDEGRTVQPSCRDDDDEDDDDDEEAAEDTGLVEVADAEEEE